MGVQDIKDPDLTKILKISRGKRYEFTCAAFDLVDHIFKVDVPPSIAKNHKLPVQAILLLAQEHIRYGYEPEKKNPTQEEEKE